MRGQRTLRAAAFGLGFAFLTAPAVAQEYGPAKDGKKRPDDKAARAERLKKVEGLFRTRDKNRDGVLESDEAHQGWMGKYDLDGNEKITMREFTEILMHPMLKAAHPMRHPRARAQQAMRGFDRGKDGLIQKDEYPGGDNVFKRADRNDDGALDWKELLRLAKDELKDNRRKMKSPGRYDFLQLFDLNRDNNVTKAEYDGPARAFAKFDDDGDGTVTYAELYPERMRREMRAAERDKPKNERKTVLQAMDTNDDGKISREEFKGTDAAWQRLDRNRDGWITAADSR